MKSIARIKYSFVLIGRTLLVNTSTEQSSAATAYTYDELGRLVTTLYDSGVCIQDLYDENGNRTAITTLSTAPGSPVWGTGIWGCVHWTP